MALRFQHALDVTKNEQKEGKTSLHAIHKEPRHARPPLPELITQFKVFVNFCIYAIYKI